MQERKQNKSRLRWVFMGFVALIVAGCSTGPEIDPNSIQEIWNGTMTGSIDGTLSLAFYFREGIDGRRSVVAKGMMKGAEGGKQIEAKITISGELREGQLYLKGVGRGGPRNEGVTLTMPIELSGTLTKTEGVGTMTAHPPGVGTKTMQFQIKRES